MTLSRSILCLILAATCLGAGAVPAAGAPARLALVIGNERYGADLALPNAAKDAALMASTLTRLGFAVTERHDLSKADFVSAVAEFAGRVPKGATALVYYAGHGMQIGGNNYLNPVDMQITSEQASPLRAYPLKALLERLALSPSAVNIVVLDACRNNPFRLQGPARYRSLGNLGLSAVQAPRGTLIAYSTAPGQLAAEGTGSNSIYTATLARLLPEAGREIEDVFKQVSTVVRRASLDDQIPWFESSLTDRFYFQTPAGVAQIAGKPLAQKGVDGANVAMRGARVPGAADKPWYRQMSASEWSEIDWEIQQRVKRMTPDEIAQFEHKAKGGNVLAQTTLGLVYREGLEKAVDVSSGRVLRFKANNPTPRRGLEQAAGAGFPVAQAELGEMYHSGHGVDRDLQASRRWLELAAAAEYPRAKLDLLQLGLESNPRDDTQMRALMEMLQTLPFRAPPRR
jgi:uncharacterized caspase-like protein